MNSGHLFLKNSRKILLNLFVAGLLFFLFNWIFFSTRIYSRFLLEDSGSGQVKLMLYGEASRPAVPKGTETAIIFGDSRLGEGFSAKLANIVTRKYHLESVNSAFPSTTPRCWYYFIKTLDRDANKYDYIVLGLPSLSKIQSDDLAERVLDLDFLAPIAEPKDYLEIAGTFSNLATQISVLKSLIAKGFVYKYDFQDFMTHPKARLRSIFRPPSFVGWFTYEYTGRPESLSGVVWDAQQKKAIYPDDYPQKNKAFIETFLASLSSEALDKNLEYNIFWTSQILKHYEHSKTKVILFQLPKGPLPTTLATDQILPAFSRLKEKYPALILLPPGKFRNLESPEFGKFQDRCRMDFSKIC